MFYSKKLNLLFIAIPKTGTVTVEDALFQLDKEGENHSITVKGKTLSGKDFAQGIIGHARANEIKNVIGEDYYFQLNTIAFIRNPLDKLVSAYHYTRKRNLYEGFKMKGNKKKIRRVISYFSSVLLAKMLPFKIWSFCYPYRSNYRYIYDEKGHRIVKNVGRTDHLESDLKSILHKIGVATKGITIKHINTSKHDDFNDYFRNKFFRSIIEFKLRRDIELYAQINHELSNDK